MMMMMVIMITFAAKIAIMMFVGIGGDGVGTDMGAQTAA